MDRSLNNFVSETDLLRDDELLERVIKDHHQMRRSAGARLRQKLQEAREARARKRQEANNNAALTATYLTRLREKIGTLLVGASTDTIGWKNIEEFGEVDRRIRLYESSDGCEVVDVGLWANGVTAMPNATARLTPKHSPSAPARRKVCSEGYNSTGSKTARGLPRLDSGASVVTVLSDRCRASQGRKGDPDSTPLLPQLTPRGDRSSLLLSSNHASPRPIEPQPQREFRRSCSDSDSDGRNNGCHRLVGEFGAKSASFARRRCSLTGHEPASIALASHHSWHLGDTADPGASPGATPGKNNLPRLKRASVAKHLTSACNNYGNRERVLTRNDAPSLAITELQVRQAELDFAPLAYGKTHVPMSAFNEYDQDMAMELGDRKVFLFELINFLKYRGSQELSFSNFIELVYNVSALDAEEAVRRWSKHAWAIGLGLALADHVEQLWRTASANETLPVTFEVFTWLQCRNKNLEQRDLLPIFVAADEDGDDRLSKVEFASIFSGKLTPAAFACSKPKLALHLERLKQRKGGDHSHEQYSPDDKGKQQKREEMNRELLCRGHGSSTLSARDLERACSVSDAFRKAGNVI